MAIAALHGLRVHFAGLVSGIAAGAIAGLGSRLVMLVIRWMNPSHNGAMTHAVAAVAAWSIARGFQRLRDVFHLYG